MSTLILNKTGAVKFEVEIPQEMTKYYKDKVFPFMRKFSKLIHGWLNSGRLKSIRGKQFIFNDDTPDLYGTDKGKLPDYRSLDDGRIKLIPEVKALIEEYFPPQNDIWSTGVSSLIYQVGNRYSSFGTRNGGRGVFAIPSKYIAFTPKACTWKSETFQYKPEDGVVTVRALEGLREKSTQFELPVVNDYYDNWGLLKKIPLTRTLKKLVTSGEMTEEEAIAKCGLAKRGGNVIFKNNRVVFPVTRELEVEKAKLWLAYDCNLSKMNFMALSHPTFLDHPEGIRLLPKTPEIKHWEEEITKCNALANSAKNKALFSHRERKLFRKKLDKAHCQQYKHIEEYIKPHFYYFLEELGFHGWGIDTVKTGNRNGTFGQDKLPLILSRLCMKNELPFYFVPTFYGSARCSWCGHVDLNARNKETNIYECSSPLCVYPETGEPYREQADLNAANNHSQFALTLQDADWPMVSHMPSSKAKVSQSTAKYLREYYALP